MSTPTTMIAAMVVPSSTRSRTAMRIRVPTRATTPLTRLTRLDDAASRRSSVSDVVRVTSSPTGRRVTAGTVARRNRRTSDSRASSTIRSATVPMRIHCASPTADPTHEEPEQQRDRLSPGSAPPTGSRGPTWSPSASPGPSRWRRGSAARPSRSVLRCGRAKPMRMRSRLAARRRRCPSSLQWNTACSIEVNTCPSVEHADTFGG